MPQFLVVDDSAVDRRLVQGLLERHEGWTVDLVENGKVALSVLEQSLPDCIITDLQMPEMDGRELVSHVRLRFPDVPVILITAHGSEELAAEALLHGAASYVPKSCLATRLEATVEEVLTRVESDRGYERLSAGMTRAAFAFTLDNDPELFTNLIELIQQIMAALRFADSTGQIRVCLALEAALREALYRGNFELTAVEAAEAIGAEGPETPALAARRGQAPFCDRKLQVDVRLTATEAIFRVAHDGPPLEFPEGGEIGAAGAFDAAADRDRVLMRAFMDDVVSEDGGRSLLLVKRAELAIAAVR